MIKFEDLAAELDLKSPMETINDDSFEDYDKEIDFENSSSHSKA